MSVPSGQFHYFHFIHCHWSLNRIYGCPFCIHLSHRVTDVSMQNDYYHTARGNKCSWRRSSKKKKRKKKRIKSLGKKNQASPICCKKRPKRDRATFQLYIHYGSSFLVSFAMSSIILSKHTASQKESKIHGGEVMFISTLANNNLPFACKDHIFSCCEK